jgi:hypothetical protein
MVGELAEGWHGLVRPSKAATKRSLANSTPRLFLTSWPDRNLLPLDTIDWLLPFFDAFVRAEWTSVTSPCAVPGACAPAQAADAICTKLIESQRSAREPGGDAARMDRLVFRVAPSSVAGAPALVHPEHELLRCYDYPRS